MAISDLLGSDSSDPSWIKEHKSPAKKAKVETRDEATSKAKKAPAAVLVESSSSDEDDDLPLAAAFKSRGDASDAGTRQKRKKGDDQQPAVAFVDVDGDDEDDDDDDDDDDGDLVFTQTTQEEPLTQTTQEDPSQSQSQSQRGGSDRKQGGSLASGSGRKSQDLVIMVPDKLLKTKVLVQFDKRNAKESLDLSGDVGAVGRFIVNVAGSNNEGAHERKGIALGQPKEARVSANGDHGAQDLLPQVAMDLKGQIYEVKVVPTVTTMVISTQGNTGEAKVESIASDVMRLEHGTKM
mmetsp:Transcript_14959/g.37930  ORF Transcript_14959/g.37930 Transcript_14959/m.37930 type:complete len:294 (-) Transcript_14959:754-1635(-)